MTHLELENRASEYLEGQLDAVRRAEVDQHLAACPACRERLEEIRQVIELCHSVEPVEPAPWLVSKILLSTIGERKPTLKEKFAAFLRPGLQQRVAYALAMAVFSFSIIVNAAGINLRNLTISDLNPRTWVKQANRTGHLLYARAEKFYYDLRVVYEIESRVRQLRGQSNQPAQAGQPATPEEREAPKQEAPPGGSTGNFRPADPQLARARGLAPSAPPAFATLLNAAAKGRTSWR